MNTLDFDKRMNSTLDYQFFVFIVSNWHYLLYSLVILNESNSYIIS